MICLPTAIRRDSSLFGLVFFSIKIVVLFGPRVFAQSKNTAIAVESDTTKSLLIATIKNDAA